MDLINREKALGCFDGWEDDHGGWHDADELPGYDKLQALPVVAEVEDCISRKWLMECVEEGWIKFDTEKDKNKFIHLVRDTAPSAQPERDIPKRVLWTGWKGYRDTRYKCPNCKKPVRNDDVYCHRCGQHLMFPHIDWTPYVEGQKQELIVRWDDE